LNVYPAASLIDYVPENCPVFIVDPNKLNTHISRDYTLIQEKAGPGLQNLKEKLIRDFA